ncbi:MAG: HEAT repeat domain-containing protein [Deltaproteobacteria bacterium]|nr:HEAT repeat domain-containing protein [Deltaproteobacteria bacterium]
MARFPAIVLCVALLALSVTTFAEDGCGEGDEACLIDVLKKGESPGAMRAAMALGKLHSAEAVEPLVDKLSSSDQYMATAALHALVEIGDAAVPDLVEATGSKKASVRRYAAHGLGRIGGGKAVEALAKLARDDDPQVRKRAAEAFARLGDKRGAFALLNLLQDRHRDVRLAAIRALATMPNDKMAPHLIDFGIGDLDGEVSMEAAALLLKIGPAGIPAMLEKGARRSALRPETPRRRRQEIGATADPGPKGQVLKYLSAVASNGQEPMEVRQAACVGLGSIGGVDAKTTLSGLVEKYQGEVQAADLVKAARTALERINATR